MAIAFTKMHGCGNDYVFIDAWSRDPPRNLESLARAVSDRHHGIGADGLILITKSRRADLRMIMHNADGSRAEMCGNGIRCAAKLAWDLGHARRGRLQVETGAGVLEVELRMRGSRAVGATVAMGRPRLVPDTVPVLLPSAGPLLRVPLRLRGTALEGTAVGMGNPHVVLFVRNAEKAPLERWGPLIEHHWRFPQRVNAEVVSRLPDEAGRPVLRQRTWERGSGITMACGTGACAVTVASILRRRIPGRMARVRLDGGDLEISWQSADAEVVMSGPAETVYSGRWGLGTVRKMTSHLRLGEIV